MPKSDVSAPADWLGARWCQLTLLVSRPSRPLRAAAAFGPPPWPGHLKSTEFLRLRSTRPPQNDRTSRAGFGPRRRHASKDRRHSMQPSAILPGLLAPPRSIRYSGLHEGDQRSALMQSCHSTRRCRHALRHGSVPINSALSADWTASFENRVIAPGPHRRDRRHKGLTGQLPDPAIASCRALAASAIPPRAAEVMSGQQRSWPPRT